MDIHTTKITEGKTKLIVPDLEYYKQFGQFPSAVAPLFYNPAMEFSRDVSVCLLHAHYLKTKRKLKIADPLASTGIRGIRYAKELGKEVEDVYLNDINESTEEFMKENIKLNKLKNVHTSITEANVFLVKNQNNKFNVIDIDPFGTPMPFIDSASKALFRSRGLISVTATDTSALCGSAANSCLRKYFAWPLHNEHMKEVGARILVSAIMKHFSPLRIGLTPVFTQSSDHYMKVFAVTHSTPSK
ncbi:MAG: tRNA (guanine(10)-N(2))-dimethyltransferase, partial [Candidatus Diapherotrites archaeon]|nr:tRNA (guanine(10)-N(2))-dimethyltransferase [Candidatus Diapherotrites archaeon]